MIFNSSFIKKDIKTVASFLVAALILNPVLFAETAPLATTQSQPAVAVVSQSQAQASKSPANSPQSDPTANFLEGGSLSNPVSPQGAAAMPTPSNPSTTRYHPDGITPALTINATFSSPSGNLNTWVSHSFNLEGEKTKTQSYVYFPDGKILQTYTQTSFDPATGSLTSETVVSRNTAGKITGWVRIENFKNGIDFEGQKIYSRVSASQVIPETGILKNTQTSYYDRNKKRSFYASDTYHADGRTIAVHFTVSYDPGTGSKNKESYIYTSPQGVKTRDWSTTYQANGITPLQLTDVLYNATTRLRASIATKYYNALGQLTRARTITYQGNGTDLSKVDTLDYNPATGKWLSQFSVWYNFSGQRFQSIADSFYPDGITKSRRVWFIFDPQTQAMLRKITTCFASNGAEDACS